LNTAVPRLDELSDGEAVRGFFGEDGDVPAHESASLGLKNGTGFEKRVDPVPAIFAADARVFGRLLLAAIFLVSGLGKIAKPA
jgi:hypothetical protein